jgi:hypothetical protein
MSTNPPTPGTGEPATFTMDRDGFIVARRPDGTILGKSNSIQVHLQFAILRRLEGAKP